ncbi:MAG: hypothetical protein J6T89_04070 [Bacteroidales bacterium]|nr:hypothetical protein [Bacteroidales bacterium]
MTLSIPARLRLDNAANIYPASMSKHYSSLYRMSMSLSEPVDGDILQKALEQTTLRIPTFRCGLKAGTFWWFLERLDSEPQVLPLKPLKKFSFLDQKGLLYRVSADGVRICLDVFHALTDGFGALSFLQTLTGEYLRLRYGISIEYDALTLDPFQAPVFSEFEDSFKSVFTGRRGTLEKNVDAFHISGDVMEHNALEDFRIQLPMESVKRLCHKYGCTVTELVCSVMLDALQKEHRLSARRKSTVLKVSVPINLRPLYGTRTLRNFSSYVNLGVDVRNGYLSFPNIVRAVKSQKERDMQQERLEPKIAANVELEESSLVKLIPLFIKHPIIDIINLLHGDRYCSQTLSNLGAINLPEAMRPYVKDVDFVLGRQRGNSGAAACLGYDGHLNLHLSRKISSDRYEKAVLDCFRSLGADASVSTQKLA